MYTRYENLTQEEIDILLNLKNELTFKDSTGTRRRMGENRNKALSVYNTSKWFDWKADQRERFRTAFADRPIKRALQGWFMEIPPDTGFLDRQTAWIGQKASGVIIATALKDQCIIIEDKKVNLKKGEQIGFSLCSVHEIKPSKGGQLWACIMIRGDHTKMEK